MKQIKIGIFPFLGGEKYDIMVSPHSVKSKLSKLHYYDTIILPDGNGLWAGAKKEILKELAPYFRGEKFPHKVDMEYVANRVVSIIDNASSWKEIQKQMKDSTYWDDLRIWISPYNESLENFEKWKTYTVQQLYGYISHIGI